MGPPLSRSAPGKPARAAPKEERRRPGSLLIGVNQGKLFFSGHLEDFSGRVEGPANQAANQDWKTLTGQRTAHTGRPLRGGESPRFQTTS